MTHNEPTADNLYNDPELAQFYDLENRWGPDFDYCLQLADDARSVLDLGCGTGQLAAGLAACRTVVGVDPAAAMLDIARHRQGGRRVTWVEGDARRIRLDRHFDLVLLTGHAFQVFLSGEDQQAVLSTIAEHLAPGGRFVFDSRNPAAQAWRLWKPKDTRRRLEHPGLGTVEAWNDFFHDAATGIVTYQTHYQIAASGQGFSAESQIRFTTQDRLAAILDQAGLKAELWLGDWEGATYEATSREIIPVGRLM